MTEQKKIDLNHRFMLQYLMEHWKKAYPKQAFGGWWALSGFSFQMAYHLLALCKQWQAGTTEPGTIHEIERLSDSVSSQEGRFFLIQAKRTLTRQMLISAVHEAYLITTLCRKECPTLLESLCFQVACSKKETSLLPHELEPAVVITENLDMATWNDMITRFHIKEPVIEETDVLDALYVWLWKDGVCDPKAFIQRCMGKLLESFLYERPEQWRELGRELYSLYQQEPRKETKPRVGHFLFKEDVTMHPMAVSSREVVTEVKPRLEHLQRGCFRERSVVLRELWSKFEEWYNNNSYSDKIPVFWISGRSGEGKSVLLLQLLEKYFKTNLPEPLLLLQRGDDIPTLLACAPGGDTLAYPGQSRIFAVVDDIYDLRDRETWEESIENLMFTQLPPVAIITCGPTDQYELFNHNLAGSFKVTTFNVNPLTLKELNDFRVWYEQRTGNHRDLQNLTTENCMLVQVMFELAQGTRLNVFAKRFKNRLHDLGLFDDVKTILAINALYMDAPARIIKSDKARDALQRLCREDQFHFTLTSFENESFEGVRLAHPHLAWILFTEWVEPPTTIAKAWARELNRVMKILESEQLNFKLGQILVTCMTSKRFTNKISLDNMGTQNEFIGELYRLHLEQHNNKVLPQILPRWLEFQYKIPGLELKPDPAVIALEMMVDELQAPSLHGSTARWLWYLSDRKNNEEKEQFRSVIKDFLMRHPNNFGTCYALAIIIKQDINDVDWRFFTINWLKENFKHLQVYMPLSSLVASNAGNAEIRKLAIQWIEHNIGHPQVYHPLSSLVASNAGGAEIRKLAIQWIEQNIGHPQAYQVLSRLVASNAGDAEIRKLAIQWIEQNIGHPQAYQVLSRLVASSAGDAEIRKLGIQWIEQNIDHPQVYQVLSRLVATNAGDAEMRKLAIQWIEQNIGHPQAYQVLSRLVASSAGDAEIRKLTIQWIKQNIGHPQVYHPLSSMVASSAGDAEIQKFAIQWIEQNPGHPQVYQLLSSLVASSAGDLEIRKRAIQWIEQNTSHPQVYQLLSSLVASSAGDPEIRKLAIQWIEQNAIHPQVYWLLSSLVASISGDPEILKLSIQWIEQNTLHAKVYEPLKSLIANNPEDEHILAYAKEWLLNNNKNAHYDIVLQTMITRTRQPEWVKLGEEYLLNKDCKRPEQILGALVTSSLAKSSHIERALDFVQDQSKLQKHRNHVLLCLVNTLVLNNEKTLEYLNGPYVSGNQLTVCSEIPIGLMRHKEAISSFVQDVFGRLDNPWHKVNIITTIIQRNLSDPILDQLIVQWLSDNWRRQGYDSVLNTLKSQSVYWKHLLTSNSLPANVLKDFSTL